MKQSNNKSAPKSLLSSLRELETGESLTFPASRASYVSSACVRFGLEWGRKFTTRTSRADRTITVTRTA